MTTRPGYAWDQATNQWIEIGTSVAESPVYFQATPPASAPTGSIWVDSDAFVPSIDSAQMLRWRKTMIGGETSISGNDDNSLSLKYTPGYEQLYINGVLQVRGQDYTATTGTTITGLTALAANDVVEVLSVVARAVADVYTQAQSDNKYAVKTAPMFTATLTSGQALPAGTHTKLLMTNELVDTNNNYDAANARFTPTVPGYYNINLSIQASSSFVYCYIAKNGSNVKSFNNPGSTCNGSAILYLNGTTDYIEAFAYLNSAGTITANQSWTWFEAAYVRSA